MYFSHVNYPSELKTVKQKNQIRLHKRTELTRYRLVKTMHWNKHTVYLTHLFNFGTLATGSFRKANGNLPAPAAARVPRTAEAARRSRALGSSRAPGKLRPVRLHWQFLVKVKCLPLISYWRHCLFPNNGKEERKLTLSP